MKALSLDEALAWFGGKIPPVQSKECHEVPAALSGAGLVEFSAKMPEDPSRRLFLVKLVFRLLEKEEDCLVLMHNWTVWPSSGHLPLALRFRQSLGEFRTLEERPGHIFPKSEFDDAISLTLIAMLFYWDCYVVGAAGRVVFFTSHDEFFQLWGREQRDVDWLVSAMGLGASGEDPKRTPA